MERRENIAAMKSPPPVVAGTVSRLDRGTTRLLRDLGYGVLPEFPLANGRRADLIGIGADGTFAIVEVKSSLADFRADGKWPTYRAFCDVFYFAVAAGFPLAVLPEDTGLILADGYQGVVIRAAPRHALPAARRKALLVRVARTAATRLMALTDAAAGSGPRDL